MTAHPLTNGVPLGKPNDISPQLFMNGEIHHWYRLIFGFSDHLVAKLLDRLNLSKSNLVLDPFCGSGTTLVECMKRGIPAVGIDANPSATFAARVKCNWSADSSDLVKWLGPVRRAYEQQLTNLDEIKLDRTYQYLENSGMIEPKWISIRPLRKAIALKLAIKETVRPKRYRELLMLALISEVLLKASNVKFGPELYCGPAKRDSKVWEGFSNRAEQMAADLAIVAKFSPPSAMVYDGDSRDVVNVLRGELDRKFSAVICSPPYPAEHDYTRNARLELAFLGHVHDRNSLRAIKQTMVRSHTKGIYLGDRDAQYAEHEPQIDDIIRKLMPKVRKKTHGFAQLYPEIVKQYFGGMSRHFLNMRKVLAKKALCAYVVGDQSSYLQVYIPTAEILASLAEKAGYEIVTSEKWRTRWSTTTSRDIDENILTIRWPG